ncbi:MAG: sigma-70 family RNA polymerase sigma factor [Planctomycetota bacterium]|nr:sigma-70 family RNA polymerase sigma factor [Planctomycetota bacterium]
MAGRITQVLEELSRGTPGAREELLQLVYDELKRLAEIQMNDQRPGHTLQPTALVNEAYLRLLGEGKSKEWEGRAHFFRTAARAMRSILVDFARARAALKRGGDAAKITFDEGLVGSDEATYQVLAVHDALQRLEERDPDMSRVVELRFFCGLTVEETGRVMGMSERSVYHVWEHARAWLFREISS